MLLISNWCNLSITWCNSNGWYNNTIINVYEKNERKRQVKYSDTFGINLKIYENYNIITKIFMIITCEEKLLITMLLVMKTFKRNESEM